jgi:hypothetical protein
MNPATFNTLIQELQDALDHLDEHIVSNSARARVNDISYKLFDKPIYEILVS